MPLERIIITFTETGDFRGASATDFAGLPVHLDPTELGKKITKLNAAALARLVEVDAEIAAAKAEADEVKASLTVIETAIDDPALDAEATLAVAKAEAVKSKLSKKQKELAEIDAQIDALQARKAEVRDAKKAP